MSQITILSIQISLTTCIYKFAESASQVLEIIKELIKAHLQKDLIKTIKSAVAAL